MIKRVLVAVFALSWIEWANAEQLDRMPLEFPETLQTTFHIKVPMRDGVELTTDVYLPSDEGKFPTLLIRDPYTNGISDKRQRYAKFATSNGYAFVIQSVRGRYDSDGHFYPYFQEIRDGAATLTWVENQEWSNGKVGMLGGSYLGTVQWAAAVTGHPALIAIAPYVSPANYYRDVAYPGGAFALISRVRWGIGGVGSRTGMYFPTIDWIDEVNHLPLITLADSLGFGFNVGHFQDWLRHPTCDAYWKPLNFEARADQMKVPALNIGGWYDAFLRSTINSYKTMTQEAATEAARKGQRLIIGPWPHSWNQSSEVGILDFGDDALINIQPLLLEWFDHWLKDAPKPEGPPVRIFVMGDNVWRSESEWPLARTDYQSYYLHADGSLATNKPSSDAAPTRYTYDPANPVPTLGGNIMNRKLRGPRDQTPLDERTDIIRFTTEPFSERTEITGPIHAVIYASSDARDTDFMAKLVVVKANGLAFNLVDGVIRARFRAGCEDPSLIEPGKVNRYEIDLWATSYALEPGDRLRLDITSSNFPRLARNLNTGEPSALTSEMRIAHQAIFSDAGHPSRVVLPIIPNE